MLNLKNVPSALKMMPKARIKTSASSAFEAGFSTNLANQFLLLFCSFTDNYF